MDRTATGHAPPPAGGEELLHDADVDAMLEEPGRVGAPEPVGACSRPDGYEQRHSRLLNGRT